MASLNCGGHVASNTGQDGEVVEEEEELHDIQTGKQINRPRGAREKSWNVEEDKVLCESWMAISHHVRKTRSWIVLK